MAFILRATSHSYVEKTRGLDTNPRILAVAFENPDGGYELVLQNHTLIPRAVANTEFDYELGNNSNGRKQAGLSFKRGALRININENMYVGPSAGVYRTYTFRFHNRRFELIGYDSTGVDVDGDELVRSYDFLTGRETSARGHGCVGRLADIQKNCRFKTEWLDLPQSPLLTMEGIGSGLEFTPKGD